MSWTTPANVLSRWVGTNAPAEASPILLELIADAEDEILRHFPNIQTRITSAALPVRRVQRVVSDVVRRAYQMGGDYRLSYSEATGPFSHSASFGADTPRVVRLTSEEIAMLAPVITEAYTLNMLPDLTYTYEFINEEEDWEVAE